MQPNIQLDDFMKKFSFILVALLAAFVFAACNNYETYSDQKEKERKAVKSFIQRNGIQEISESEFKQNGYVTDTAKNEYVYLNNSGVYMQIVRKGSGTPLQDGENATLYIRFLEMSILDTTYVIYNYDDPYDPDVMSISRSGNNYTASFTSGLMLECYSAQVPTGWLVPFNYIKVGPPSETEDIAKVRLIVPHTQGHTAAASEVVPFYYEITFQR